MPLLPTLLHRVVQHRLSPIKNVLAAGSLTFRCVRIDKRDGNARANRRAFSRPSRGSFRTRIAMLREDHAVNAAAQSGPVQAVETMLRRLGIKY